MDLLFVDLKVYKMSLFDAQDTVGVLPSSIETGSPTAGSNVENSVDVTGATIEVIVAEQYQIDAVFFHFSITTTVQTIEAMRSATNMFQLTWLEKLWETRVIHLHHSWYL